MNTIFDIEQKQDTPEKLAAAAGKPTKYFMFADEFNLIVDWIKNFVPSLGLIGTTTGNDTTQEIAFVTGKTAFIRPNQNPTYDNVGYYLPNKSSDEDTTLLVIGDLPLTASYNSSIESPKTSAELNAMFPNAPFGSKWTESGNFMYEKILHINLNQEQESVWIKYPCTVV